MFYGSQTGTAEEFANRLSKDAHRYGMRGMAADPEEYDLVSARRALTPSPQAVRFQGVKAGVSGSWRHRGRVRQRHRQDWASLVICLSSQVASGHGECLAQVRACALPSQLSMLQAVQVLGRCPQKGPRHLMDWVWPERGQGLSRSGEELSLVFPQPPILDCSGRGAGL